MNVSLILIKQLLIMAVYSTIGYIFTKKNLLTKNGCNDLTNILLYLIIPSTIINSYLTIHDETKTKLLVQSIIVSIIALTLSMLISYVFFKKRDRIGNFSSSFSNAGFIGIPLVQAVLGQECVFFVASFVAFLNIFQWIYGVFILTDDLNEISITKIIKNPVVISFVFAIFVYMLNISNLSFLKNLTASLAAINSPLAMILIGSFLTQTTLKEMITNKSAIKCSVVRLVLIPIITVFVFKFLNIDSTIKIGILLVSCAPVGANVVMFAQKYNNDYKSAVEVVVLSSILSLVSMPTIIFFSNFIGV